MNGEKAEIGGLGPQSRLEPEDDPNHWGSKPFCQVNLGEMGSVLKRAIRGGVSHQWHEQILCQVFDPFVHETSRVPEVTSSIPHFSRELTEIHRLFLARTSTQLVADLVVGCFTGRLLL